MVRHGCRVDLKELVVEHFRGIDSLTWRPSGCVICLIGAGDATKTTVLDAIDLVLGTRWAVQLSDLDFYNADITKPIRITATVAALPQALLKEERFGLDLRGWNLETQALIDEPDVDCEPVLTIQFTADDSLEPQWHIINDRREEPRVISSRDREHLGIARLSADVDRHLAWGRGSALTRATSDLSEVPKVIAAANREARQAVDKAALTKLVSAATGAQKAAIQAGASTVSTYRPGLEASVTSSFSAQLAIHDGDIPLKAAGLATRRLNAVAFQLQAVESGAVLLVDEIEHGLEPFRLRHLLKHLSKCVGETGRVILTTHSRITVEELPASALHVVRSNNGTTTITAVGPQLQALVRSNAEALLARRIVVCEGRTDIGLCMGLSDYWATKYAARPVAHTGTAFADGGGSSVGKRAELLAALGYDVIVLADSDASFSPGELELQEKGIDAFLWSGQCCTEQRIALDVPLSMLKQMVAAACASFTEQSILDTIKAHLTTATTKASLAADPEATIAAGGDEIDLRSAIGKAAHNGGWFKDIARGTALGRLVGRALPKISTSPLAATIDALGKRIYE